MPDGVSSNIRRCVDVKSCKVSGFKTHDYHLILQKLLPFVVRRILPEDVVIALIQLSNFFDALCSKELVEAGLVVQLGRLFVDLRCYSHLHFLISLLTFLSAITRNC